MGAVVLHATRSSAGTESDVSEGESGGDGVLGLFNLIDGAQASTSAVPWPFRYHAGQVRLQLGKSSSNLAANSYSQAVPKGPLNALSYQYASRVFERVDKNPLPMGIVRRGTRLRANERVYGPGCKGSWYPLTTGGYACTSDGFHVTSDRKSFDMRQLAPALDEPLPYRYAKLTNGALRFYRIPTRAEEAAIAAHLAGSQEDSGTRMPEVVEDVLDGAYFAAIDRVEKKDSRRFYRTVRGRYMRVEDVEPRELPPMHGEILGGRWKLPLGFVHGDEPVDILHNGEVVGSAEKHGRMPVVRAGTRFVTGPGDYKLPRDRVRIARRVKVPEGIPEDARWVHVDLTEQTLVAYEGSRPVFATLVSSGLEEPEFATPTGLYQVREKHVSVTMNGPDPDAGRYEVEEVPWTQYYYESYAIHGAYWHNNFGRVRSHGCTNVAPIDARWLFLWTSPDLPPGWHARRRAEGTYLSFTRKSE